MLCGSFACLKAFTKLKFSPVFGWVRSNSGYSIVFYGTDGFSEQCLRSLHANYKQTDVFEPKVVRHLTVVTGSENNDVYNFSKHNEIPLKLWPYKLPENEFDLGVVASFGKLIPEDAINSCKYGMINVHASLLPRWRGAAPIQQAILNGDKESGVTLMKIKAHKFDIGECIMQTPVLLPPRITAKELHRILSLLGSKSLMKCLQNLDHYLRNAKQQSSENITYAKKFKKEDGLIVWHKMSVNDVDRRFRAFDGFIDLYTHWIDGSMLRLLDIVDPLICAEAKIDDLLVNCEYSSSDIKPGFLFYHKRRKLLFVMCSNNEWIAFRSVWPIGRKPLSAAKFHGNYMSRIGKGTAIVLGNSEKKDVTKNVKDIKIVNTT